MKLEIKDGEVIHKTDLRELLNNGAAREILVQQLSAHVEAKLVRAHGKLCLVMRDKPSNALVTFVDLREALTASLAEGTMVHDTLDHLPADEALAEVETALEDLLRMVQDSRKYLGTPEESMVDTPLPQRPATVEQEAEQVLQEAG